MTGRSTDQMPDCFSRNNNVNEAYNEKQKQKLLQPAGGATIYSVWLLWAL